jgi:uncharacterized protein YxeA
MKPFLKILILIIFAVFISRLFFIWQDYKESNIYVDPNDEEVYLAEPLDENSQDEFADWPVYRNENYGFEIKYPAGTDLSEFDVDGELQVRFEFTFSATEKNLNRKTLELYVRSQELVQGVKRPVTCDLNDETSLFETNGVIFNKNDISGEFGGTQNAATATEYCVKREDLVFKLRFILGYNRYSQLPKFDQEEESIIFDQALSTFKFLD